MLPTLVFLSVFANGTESGANAEGIVVVVNGDERLSATLVDELRVRLAEFKIGEAAVGDEKTAAVFRVELDGVGPKRPHLWQVVILREGEPLWAKDLASLKGRHKIRELAVLAEGVIRRSIAADEEALAEAATAAVPQRVTADFADAAEGSEIAGHLGIASGGLYVPGLSAVTPWFSVSAGVRLHRFVKPRLEAGVCWGVTQAHTRGMLSHQEGTVALGLDWDLDNSDANLQLGATLAGGLGWALGRFAGPRSEVEIARAFAVIRARARLRWRMHRRVGWTLEGGLDFWTGYPEHTLGSESLGVTGPVRFHLAVRFETYLY